MMTEVLPMSFLTKAFFWGYVAMLFLAGGAGVLLTRLELTRVFHLDLGTLSSLAESTLLNQYRFLKSMEIGFGLYCVVFREEIFTLRRFNRLFLGILFLAAGARIASGVADGWPHWAFIAFAFLELVTGCLVFLWTRGKLRNA